MTRIQRANIQINNLHCVHCARIIKKELSTLKNISNIFICIKEAAVIFNFISANDLSNVENHLLLLGFPIKGDRKDHDEIKCFCNK